MKFRLIISSFVVALISFPLSAAELPLEHYPHARIMFQSVAANDDYVLALSSYKKIAGSWRVDRQQRLAGMLARYTLELPEGHGANKGFDFYLEQLYAFNVRELFHCKSRDCGTSNSWANNHFKILQLYGLDQYQQYGAYEVITADAKPFYVSLYAVQRGNKRVYLQVDVLHTDKVIEVGIASSPESIIKSLLTNGYYMFPDFIVSNLKSDKPVQVKPAHIQALVDVLALEPDWKVALVGHDYAPVSLAQQQKYSLVYADQLKAELLEQGVSADRISSYGFGSLAPAGRGDRSARVEIVKVD
ncbi:DUF4892 domain-containing protein [Cellvibrio sp. UBA7661]|uniref:DUF4892 domain-containing protein n=1 Tax=Cellvibrio sp. UBA7661 TaxID=1946311 RepID=UPI002F352BEA